MAAPPFRWMKPARASRSMSRSALSHLAGQFDQAEIGRNGYGIVQRMVQAFAQSAGITLHVENLYGENNHHIVESCFKALARFAPSH